MALDHSRLCNGDDEGAPCDCDGGEESLRDGLAECTADLATLKAALAESERARRDAEHEAMSCRRCMDATVDAAQAERERAIAERDAYREALRALVEAMPRCQFGGCNWNAVAVEEDAALMDVAYCAEHGYAEGAESRVELRLAAPLRAAIALLRGPA